MSKAINYCIDVFDGTHESPKPTNYGYKLITSKNIMNGYLDFTDSYFISKDDYEKINLRSKVNKWDVLFSMIGTVGNVCLIEEDNFDFAIKNIGVFSCNCKNKSVWLYYYLQSPYIKKLEKNYLNGAIQKFLPLNWLRELEIPDLDTHKERISGILYSIDAQIKRNNEMVQKLQVLAHTTFDYFSKNNNRSNFLALNDIIIEKNKSKIQVSDIQDASGFIPFFTSGEAVLYANEKLETGFNIFLSTGGNAKVQEYYGDVAYSTDTWCITAKNNLQFYLFGYLKHIESQMNNLYFHGTGLKHLQKPLFLKSIISIPNEDLLMKYNTIVKPIYRQMSKIEQSTIQLQYLKNKLLPLLINQQLT